jgi:threonine 3-dehydrogenase
MLLKKGNIYTLRPIKRNNLKKLTKNFYSSTQIHAPKILITGAFGQIGTELATRLREKYGVNSVIAADIKKSTPEIRKLGPYQYIDVTNQKLIEKVVAEEGITWLIHLSSILSASGEKNINWALELNIRGIENVMEVARKYDLRVYAPSSIAAFGPLTPRVNTPDITNMRPTTIYGISKVYLELLGEYYHNKWGVDFRSLRYPGILSSETLPGGGTTDYAIDIFYKALTKKQYTCFLEKDARLPMMYMPDCLNATINFIEADQEDLKLRTYNVAAVSFTPEEIANEIKKHIPDFTMNYAPDFRNDIAKSWPESLDDSNARNDWNWKHTFDLAEMTKNMLENIGEKVKSKDFKGDF